MQTCIGGKTGEKTQWPISVRTPAQKVQCCVQVEHRQLQSNGGGSPHTDERIDGQLLFTSSGIEEPPEGHPTCRLAFVARLAPRCNGISVGPRLKKSMLPH